MIRDDKKIGRNIKAIRNANEKSYIDFAEDIGISQSYLEKIENGSRSAMDHVIENISKNTGFSFQDIKFGDLTYLEKGDLSFSEELKMQDFTREFNIKNHIIEYFKRLFPFISNKKTLKSEKFSKAMDIVKRIINLDFELTDAIEAINYFNSSKIEGVNELSSLNILSCFGYIYMLFFNGILEDFNEEELNRIKFKTTSELFGEISKLKSERLAVERKKTFMKSYNGLLTHHMTELNKSKNYQDFVIYYLFVRYRIGMLDNDITKLDDFQMELFSLSLLDCIAKMGNKYAIALIIYLEE